MSLQNNWLSSSTYLIFVKLAVLVGRLSLLLEGDDDKTDEDVDHEEGNDNDVNEIENGHNGSIIVDWSDIFGIGIDRHIQNPGPTWKRGILLKGVIFNFKRD